MCFSAVGLVTFVAFRVIPVNATTVGFAYMLLVLIVASTWGFFEASLTSEEEDDDDATEGQTPLDSLLDA